MIACLYTLFFGLYDEWHKRLWKGREIEGLGDGSSQSILQMSLSGGERAASLTALGGDKIPFTTPNGWSEAFAPQEGCC